jgi:hypothetical protein
MIEAVYDGSIQGLFGLLEGCGGTSPFGAPPDRVRGNPPRVLPHSSGGPPEQPDFFSPAGTRGGSRREEAAALLRLCGGSGPEPGAADLFSLSAPAYGHFLYGWMSEFPIETELVRFAWTVIAAAREAGKNLPGGISTPEARAAAEKAAGNRGDPATETVLRASFKTGRELHRLQGLLRFSAPLRPGREGYRVARCAPDHFVLPALALHFSPRFGETPWAVVDEKRGLSLIGPPGKAPFFLPGEPPARPPAAGEPDVWEEHWRNYHRSINNGERKNPRLQRQFMPARYWKYLPECFPPEAGPPNPRNPEQDPD